MPTLRPEHVLEATLLSSAKPLALRELRRLFDDRLSAKTVREHLEGLQDFWKDRGLRLVEAADGWRFQTADVMEPYVRRTEVERPRAYSRAAMETLAVIAYRQPVTRGDIEAIRGVTVHPQILRQFEERGWIETVGHRETPGRPALIATTKQFLSDLGLRSLEELPAIGETAEPLFELGLSDVNGGAAEEPLPSEEIVREEDR